MNLKVIAVISRYLIELARVGAGLKYTQQTTNRPVLLAQHEHCEREAEAHARYLLNLY